VLKSVGKKVLEKTGKDLKDLPMECEEEWVTERPRKLLMLCEVSLEPSDWKDSD
jgi:hypothetical protein